jgi:hypothetical protein
MPDEIPANGAVEIEMIALPKAKGVFHQRVLFFTDSKRQFVASADVVGFVQGN